MCLVVWCVFTDLKKSCGGISTVHVINNGKLTTSTAHFSRSFSLSFTHYQTVQLLVVHALLRPLLYATKYRFHYTHWRFIVFTLRSVFSYLTRLSHLAYIFQTQHHKTHIHAYSTWRVQTINSCVLIWFKYFAFGSFVRCCRDCHRQKMQFLLVAFVLFRYLVSDSLFFRYFFYVGVNERALCFRPLRLRFPHLNVGQIYSILKIMYFHSVLYFIFCACEWVCCIWICWQSSRRPILSIHTLWA